MQTRNFFQIEYDEVIPLPSGFKPGKFNAEILQTIADAIESDKVMIQDAFCSEIVPDNEFDHFEENSIPSTSTFIIEVDFDAEKCFSDEIEVDQSSGQIFYEDKIVALLQNEKLMVTKVWIDHDLDKHIFVLELV